LGGDAVARREIFDQNKQNSDLHALDKRCIMMINICVCCLVCSDVSKHLVAAPVPVAVPAPVEYAAPAPVAYAAPQVYHHAVAPVFTSSSYQYNHRYPGYTAYAAAPAYYY